MTRKPRPRLASPTEVAELVDADFRVRGLSTQWVSKFTIVDGRVRFAYVPQSCRQCESFDDALLTLDEVYNATANADELQYRQDRRKIGFQYLDHIRTDHPDRLK